MIILSSIFCNTYQDWWQAFTLNDWCVIHRWNRCTYTYVCSYLKLPSLIYIHLDLDLNYYHAFKETDHLFLFCCSHPEIVVAIPCRFYLTCLTITSLMELFKDFISLVTNYCPSHTLHCDNWIEIECPALHLS